MSSTAEAQTPKSQTTWQLVVSYGIGSWIVLQVAETLSSLVGLPLWFGQTLLVLLIVGLCILLATSVVQRSAERGAKTAASELLTWKNALRAGAGLAVLMFVGTGGYLGLRAAGVGPVGTLQARGVFEEQERLILTDFETNGDDTELGEAVTTLLRIDLAQSQAVTVLEPVQLEPVLARMQRDPSEPVTYDVALEAARREGIKAIVTGEVIRTGESVVISARIVTAAAGEVLVAVRETARSASDVPDAVDQVSAQLRERVGESLRTIQGDPPLADVTTSSMQALEKYAQAERANDRGDMSSATMLLEEALDEDSTFAMAHRKLGIVLQNRGVDEERRLAAFTRAWELRDRLSDRESLLAEAAYLAYVEEDEPASSARYVTLLESYPNDRIALNNLAIAYRAFGRQREAADLYLRSIRNGGAPASTFEGAVSVLFELGDTAQAREAVDEFVGLYPENPSAQEMGINFLTAVFEYDDALVEATEALERNRGSVAEVSARLALAQIYLVQGRVQEGLEAFTGTMELIEDMGAAEQAGISAGAVEALVSGLVLLNYDESPTDAVRVAKELWAANDLDSLSSEQRQDLQFAALFATAGDVQRAREITDAYAAERSEVELEREGRWHLVQGLIALDGGDFDAAVSAIHKGRDENRACALCGLQELAHAFDHAAMPDSAIHYYEQYLSTRDLRRLQNADNLALWEVLPRLGALHAEHGEAERAREVLTFFLDASESADARYAPKRDRVRALLNTLDEAGGRAGPEPPAGLS